MSAAKPHIRLGNLKGWASPVAFGVIEQAILSGVNFAFTAAMAHALGSENFGWLSIAWAMLLFMEAGSQGLFGDAVPATTRRLPATLLPHFRGTFLTLSFVYSLGVLGLCLLTWAIAAALHFAHAALIPATALAFVGLRAQNAARRLYYLNGHRREAAFAALLNASAMLVGTLVLMRVLHSHSATLAMLLAAAANTLAAALLFVQRGAVPLAMPTRALAGWALIRLWRTGRWLFATNSMSWLGNFGLVVIVGALMGVRASGTLRVIMTLTNPPAQLVLVLLSIIVPKVAAKPRAEVMARQWPIALRSMALIGGLTGGYAVVITAVGGWLPHALFGASATGITPLTIAIATFGFSLESVRYGCNVVLLSRGRTAVLTIGQMFALLAAMVLVPLAVTHSFDWIVVAMTVSNNFNTILVFIYFLVTTDALISREVRGRRLSA